MKPNRKPLGRNPLSDTPYRNPGMVLNGQGPSRHPLGGAPCHDLDAVLNGQGSSRHPLGGVLCRDLDAVSSEQGSSRRFLSGTLHRHPSVVTNVQGSSHLSQRVSGVRKLVEPTRIHVGSWNVGSLTGKLRELVDAASRRRVNFLCPGEKMEGAKSKEGGEHWF